MSTISKFILNRLTSSLGLKHVFGVPGDYILPFYNMLSTSKEITLINTTDETHAGFAANTYSRLAGVGCACVTYGVGALKTINAVACAFAEHCPVVIISGAPGIKERETFNYLHHTAGNFNSQVNMFKEITCASVVIDDQISAGFKIDEAIYKMLHFRRPIYIELPRDFTDKSIFYDIGKQGIPKLFVSNPDMLRETLEETIGLLRNAKKPLIMAGVQVARYGFGEKLLNFAENNRIPIVSTLLSKSVIDENHPLYLGVYTGFASKPDVKNTVETSDCLLMLGEQLTDLTLSFRPSQISSNSSISCSVDACRVKNHYYRDVNFQDFCTELFSKKMVCESTYYKLKEKQKEVIECKDVPITSETFYKMINNFISPAFTVIADIGDALFGSSDLVINKDRFVGSAYYTSMGTAIPGALGIQFAAPDTRPIVLVGDGAAQMSITEISTLIAHKKNAIICILNNGGYSTERFLLEGSFNDIHNWDYHEAPRLFKGGKGYVVKTELDLKNVLEETSRNKDELFILNIFLDKLDVSPALKRMTESLSKSCN